jgi:hypothetical protein
MFADRQLSHLGFGPAVALGAHFHRRVLAVNGGDRRLLQTTSKEDVR